MPLADMKKGIDGQWCQTSFLDIILGLIFFNIFGSVYGK